MKMFAKEKEKSTPMDTIHNLGSAQDQWSKPQDGWLKINADTSFSEDDRMGQWGVIIRDCNGLEPN
jgi:hypothetical protein